MMRLNDLRSRLSRLFFFFSLVFTAAFFFVIFTPVANYMAASLVVSAELEQSDLIAVLGGGAFENRVLGGASNERMIQGLMLYKSGYAPEVIFVGGSILKPSKKVLHTITRSEDASEIDVVEAELMRNVSVILGMDSAVMHYEAESTHTQANLVAVNDFMNAKGLKSCLVVSSPTHMSRVMGVVEKLGMNCKPAPVDDYTPYIRSTTGRLSLMHAVLWEYAGIMLYKYYDYI